MSKNIKRKYVKMYVDFITQLHMYEKGYLPISLIPPSKLQEILIAVRKTILDNESRL